MTGIERVVDGQHYEVVWHGGYHREIPAPPQLARYADVERVAITRRPPASERVIEALSVSPCTQTQLARYVRGSSQHLRAVLAPMVADGRVVRWETAPRQGTRGKPQVMYRLAEREDL